MGDLGPDWWALAVVVLMLAVFGLLVITGIIGIR